MAEIVEDHDPKEEFRERLRNIYTKVKYSQDSGELPSKDLLHPEDDRAFEALAYDADEQAFAFTVLLDAVDVLSVIPGAEKHAIDLAQHLRAQISALRPMNHSELRKEIRAAYRKALSNYKAVLSKLADTSKDTNTVITQIEDLMMIADGKDFRELLDMRDRLKIGSMMKSIQITMIGGFIFILLLAFPASKVFW